jgi:RelE-like toxin of type II toxin-antitoxin system HigB
LSYPTLPRAARETGLLTSEALERLLADAIRRRQAADALLAISERMAEAGIAPMSINDQWRVIFRWSDGDAAEVQIVDYH